MTEGTKYLLSKTDPPKLELADDDGSPACAWYFETADDSQERAPFNQIVNVAVRDLQNIGNYCVWLDVTKPAPGHSRSHAAGQASTTLDAAFGALTEERKKELATLIPEGWTGGERDWRMHCVRSTALGDRRYLMGVSAAPWTGDNDVLLGALKAYTAEVKAGCVPVAASGSSGIAVRPMRMYGSGASRTKDRTYRWDTDGAYIFGADSKTVPSEQTYWTDNDGQLIGGPEGAAGQTWTIKPWTPPPAPKASLNDYELTGLFGPLGAFL
ncbi:hypothetical protein [Streptomyces sp. NPDC093093]|uniref:hypothetical protein n=1 Tax=Streptomyces sp. NPDC093093 TaxID=3366025 RepID=UPI003807049F